MHQYNEHRADTGQDGFNPYRPPEANIDVGARPAGNGEQFAWRDGRQLVVLRDKPLPPRCVKCNAEVKGPFKPRKFYWHTPWLAPLIFAGILIYVIAALIARKRSEHAVALCPTHARRRMAFTAGAWAGFLLGVCVVFMGDVMTLIGSALILAAIVIGLAGAGRVLTPVRIDDRYARFRGAREAFLSSLPVLPAHRRR